MPQKPSNLIALTAMALAQSTGTASVPGETPLPAVPATRMSFAEEEDAIKRVSSKLFNVIQHTQNRLHEVDDVHFKLHINLNPRFGSLVDINSFKSADDNFNTPQSLWSYFGGSMIGTPHIKKLSLQDVEAAVRNESQKPDFFKQIDVILSDNSLSLIARRTSEMRDTLLTSATEFASEASDQNNVLNKWDIPAGDRALFREDAQYKLPETYPHNEPKLTAGPVLPGTMGFLSDKAAAGLSALVNKWVREMPRFSNGYAHTHYDLHLDPEKQISDPANKMTLTINKQQDVKSISTFLSMRMTLPVSHKGTVTERAFTVAEFSTSSFQDTKEMTRQMTPLAIRERIAMQLTQMGLKDAKVQSEAFEKILGQDLKSNLSEMEKVGKILRSVHPNTRKSTVDFFDNYQKTHSFYNHHGEPAGQNSIRSASVPGGMSLG